jgi:hypothetical protein
MNVQRWLTAAGWAILRAPICRSQKATQRDQVRVFGSIPLLRVGLAISIIAPTDKRWRINVNRRDSLPGARTLDEFRAPAR